ncbi:hypothetical protein GPECTOR_117g360 [Gonium pectorale]|uniref:Uncharacterized protein n=1 Tax=Gonium pectorale TaxID=33097 RepID=A0A150G004_GONPE|nr:hypothetical protein GPECTOR_117g360 [Gonium pectorale]|eukprot:KXZ42795.1 hypothetical protein GPECTOR_117g360 [Gonium pectorale]
MSPTENIERRLNEKFEARFKELETKFTEQAAKEKIASNARMANLEDKIVDLNVELVELKQDLDPLQAQQIGNIVHQVAKLVLAGRSLPNVASSQRRKTYVDHARGKVLKALADTVGLDVENLKVELGDLALKRNDEVHPPDLPTLDAAVEAAKRACKRRGVNCFACELLDRYAAIRARCRELLGC